MNIHFRNKRYPFEVLKFQVPRLLERVDKKEKDAQERRSWIQRLKGIAKN